jgi:hypothetical protein
MGLLKEVGSAAGAAPIDPVTEAPAASTRKRGRPVGSKVSKEGRLNMRLGWDDERREVARAKWAKRTGKRLRHASGGLDPDFDEGF